MIGAIRRSATADRGRMPAGRVGERAEEVERGRDAEFAAGRAGVPHRRGGRPAAKQKVMPDLGGQFGHPLPAGRSSADAELLEHVSGPARRRRRAVAVLDDPVAGAGRDHRGHRGDVDGVRAVAAGADDVDAPGRAPRSGSPVLEHRLDQAGQLVDASRPSPAAPPGSRPTGPAVASPVITCSIAHAVGSR